MRRVIVAAAALAAAVAAAAAISAQAPRLLLFEGARVIVGDSSPPIPGAAFIVENGTITRVGKQGEITAPSGATRIDLAGKTVMPALIDVHVHLGYRKDATFTADNYTRENLVVQLQRFASNGVAAVASAGTDRGNLTFTLRDRGVVNGAMVRTAGRGIAPPDAGPNPPMRAAPYGVSTVDEARQAVRELAASHADFVKIWVDDRNGTVKKLSPDLYRAIIEEAHQSALRVFAHIATLADAKDLLRAGVDGFLHPVRDRDVDDELLGLLRQKPAVFFALTLFAPRLNASSTPPRWLNESLRSGPVAPEVDRLRELVTARKPEAVTAGRAEWDQLVRNVAKLNAAGVKLVLGTDVGGASAGGLFGWAEHVELENMVIAGLTPAQAIVAATSAAASVLDLDKLGTIAAGKSADFLVLDRDPLQEISNTRRISSVYLRGREVPHARGAAAAGVRE